MAVKDKYNIEVADLRKTVSFLQNGSPSPDGAGGQGDEYFSWISTRCRLRNTSGSKMFEDGQIGFINKWELVTRYRSDLWTGINSDTICEIDGVQYRIDNWSLTDMTKHFIVYTLASFNAVNGNSD